MGRLLTVTRDSNIVEEYQYDPVGRRTYEMNVFRGISGKTFAYSDEDHLLTAGDTAYQYDSDGFLTGKTNGTNQTSYVYSSRGGLLTVNLPDGRAIEYINDPLGRRMVKKVNGVVVEKYLWQGLTRLLAVYDGSDNLVMRFEYADSRIPVTMTSGGITYYLTYNQVGSLRMVADATSNVIKRIDYDSFGNIINDTNPGFEIPFGFAGGLHDRDTGLVRFGFRDYEPEVARWTAKDPIGFDGDDTDLYGYCLNDPINLIDPGGLKYAEQFAAMGAGTGLVLTAAGSIVVDAATGGINIIATPAELAAGTAIGFAVGYAIGSLLDLIAEEPIPSACYFAKEKGERRWEKGRGDDPFWNLTPDDLRKIERDPNKSRDERNRARKIRKMKEKKSK
jgi:RHS repeat-associated protein